MVTSSSLRSASKKTLARLVAAASALAIPLVAQAQPSCVLADAAQSCILKTDYSAFRVEVDERGKIVVIFGVENGDEEGESFVTVQDDLNHSLKDQEKDGEAVDKIESELATFDGVRYRLPPANELKASLGFPAGADVGAEDYLELIRVHMQVVLSASAAMSVYLSDLMGLRVLPRPSVASPAKEDDFPLGRPIIDERPAWTLDELPVTASRN